MAETSHHDPPEAELDPAPEVGTDAEREADRVPGGETAAEEGEPAKPWAPTFGCVMFALIFMLFSGALVYGIVAGVRMYGEVASFTDDYAAELPEEKGTPAELSAAKAKVEGFIEAVEPNAPPLAELALSARELNILIANHSYLGDLRGALFVEEITPAGLLRTKVSRPIPQIVFWKPRRYLNGEIDYRPEAREGNFFLRVAEVRAPGKEIAPGILEYMRTEDLLTPYKEDERFEAVMKKINSVRVEGGAVIVSTARAADGAEVGGGD